MKGIRTCLVMSSLIHGAVGILILLTIGCGVHEGGHISTVFGDYYPDKDQALLAAAGKGRYDLVLKALERGANPNARPPNYHGRTAMFELAEHSECYMQGPLTARDERGCTVCREIASMLMRYGADVNTTDDLGQTPLIVARRAGCPDLQDLLLANGAR